MRAASEWLTPAIKRPRRDTAAGVSSGFDVAGNRARGSRAPDPQRRSSKRPASPASWLQSEPSELIPLCHPLPLTHVDVQARIEDFGVCLESTVSTNAQTGVEMEALTAVSVAALTIYDMCKALDKSIVISGSAWKVRPAASLATISGKIVNFSGV